MAEIADTLEEWQRSMAFSDRAKEWVITPAPTYLSTEDANGYREAHAAIGQVYAILSLASAVRMLALAQSGGKEPKP